MPSSSAFARHQRTQRLLVALMLAALGTVVALLVAYERQLTLQREGELMMLQARVIDENLTQQLAGMDAALTSVRDDMAALHSGGLSQRGSQRLKALAEAMPGVRTMIVTDAEGIARASNLRRILGADLSHRPYFQEARARPSEERLYVSAPFQTMLGVYSLNLVKIRTDGDGHFAGIISATLDPEYFKVLLNSVLYAPDMRSLTIHGGGRVLLAAPTSNPAAGTELGVPGSFFSRHVATGQQASLMTGRTLFSDEDRMAVYRTVQPGALHMDHAMVLSVSRITDAVLAPWRKLAWLYGLTNLTVVLVACASTFVLQRQQKALVRMTLLRERESREQAERIDLALAGANLGLWELDLATGQRQTNARANDMLGLDAGAPTENLAQWLERVHPDDRQALEEVFAARAQHAEADNAFAIDYRVRHSDGRWIWIHSRGKPTDHDDDGAALRLVGTYLDITQRKDDEARIAALAFHDPLTHLPNRRLLQDRLEQAQHLSARADTFAALLFLDLDRFKWVNDTLGHDAGDQLLLQVAARLRACVRQSDTVARLGGDEFVLLVQPLGESSVQARANAQTVVNTVLAALRQPVALGDTQHTVTTSIGVALFRGAHETADQIIKRADQAMYQAKSSGRNQAHVDAAMA